MERERSVFINCPFDHAYTPIFNALVFAVAFCGFKARSALELNDAGDLRLARIVRLIAGSRFSIHDISRVELDEAHGLPRFNMPLELGIAIGMKHLGRSRLRDHLLLVLDSERFRYQRFASDLAGVDICEHESRPDRAIGAVRDFLTPHANGPLPGARAIGEALAAFEATLPEMAQAVRQRPEEMTFLDRLGHINIFLGGAA